MFQQLGKGFACSGGIACSSAADGLLQIRSPQTHQKLGKLPSLAGLGQLFGLTDSIVKIRHGYASVS